MNFFLVEPTYYRLRLLVEAKTPFGARNKAKRWIRANKGIYITDWELEVEKVFDPDTVQDAVRI